MKIEEINAEVTNEAEENFLSALIYEMYSPKGDPVFEEIQKEHVTREWFSNPLNGLLFEYLLQHHRSHPGLLHETWKTFRQHIVTHAESVEQRDRLLLLLQRVGNDVDAFVDRADYFMDGVRKFFMWRKFCRLISDIRVKLWVPKTLSDLDGLASELCGRLLNLFPPRGHSMMACDLLDDVRKELFEQIDNGPGDIKGLRTGFPRLDSVLYGLKEGEMIIVAARPSVGKTTLAMHMAFNVAKAGHHALIFSLEMDARSLVKRLVIGESEFDTYKAENVGFADVEKERAKQKIDEAIALIRQKDILIEDEGISDIAQIRAHARMRQHQNAVDLIVVDYLQLLNAAPMMKFGLLQKTTYISAQLKAMARELRIPVIVLSQLSRAPEKTGDDDEKPRLSDLRDSGAIEQDADVVILLRRPAMTKKGKKKPGEERVVYLDVAKHRNGRIGELAMEFQGEFYRFAELDEAAYQDAVKKGGLVAAKTPARPSTTDYTAALND